MGVITRIEERIGGLVEKPFQLGHGLDLVQVEIALKRFIVNNKKSVLDKTYVHHSYMVVLKDDVFTENEPFIRHYTKLLKSYLVRWLQEKDYKTIYPLVIDFFKGVPQHGLFEILISREKQQHGILEISSGSLFPLQKHVTIIGRDEDCHICLTDDTVSRKHAQLSIEKDTFILTDLCSSNGTRVNKDKISKIRLHGGEKILFGAVACVYMSDINT